MTVTLVLAAAVLTAASGAFALALRSRPALAQKVATAVLVLGAALGLAGAGLALAGGGAAFTAPWSQPAGALSIRVDGLSAIFLVPVLALRGRGYRLVA